MTENYLIDRELLLQNLCSFFLVSYVGLSLLPPIIAKWTAAPLAEPENQIQESKCGKSSTQDFQDAESHFSYQSSSSRETKLVAKSDTSAFMNVLSAQTLHLITTRCSGSL